MPGRVLVISGPSGVGKTSVCDALLADPEIVRVTTATTRGLRPGEVDGQHYHFLSPDAFAEHEARGFFLETAEVFGRRYGTPRVAVEQELAAGRSVILNIDVQGAASIRALLGERLLTIFLMPPSEETLAERLRARGSEDKADLERRLAEARHEMDQRDRFDAVVVNDDLTRAAEEIRAILRRGCESGADHG